MKVEEHIAFSARHGDWRVSKKLTEMENERIAHFLAGISNTVNTKVSRYLSEGIDIEGIESLAESLTKENLKDTIMALKSPGTTRKLGQMVRESDKKLKKLLVDVSKAYLVRETLKSIVPVEYPDGILEGIDVEFPFEEDHVSFTAKHERWIVVKRIIIDNKTPMLDVARLLASINETTVAKIPVYAGIDVEGIREKFSKFKRVKKSDIPNIVGVYESIDPLAYAEEEFEEYAKLYALRTLLGKVGLSLDIPSKSLEKYLEKK